MAVLKKFYFIVFGVLNVCIIQAQEDSASIKLAESARTVIAKPELDSARKIFSPKKDLVVTNAIDSSFIKDSVAKSFALIDSLRKDSMMKANEALTKKKADSTTYYAILPQSFFPFNQSPFFMMEPEKMQATKDELFYLLAGIMLLVGIIKIGFPKYFQNIFQLFLQTSFRQKQTRDQLLLGNLPSLLMNLLFIICSSMYVALIKSEYGSANNFSFWKLFALGVVILSIIYVGKYSFLVFAGWVFNMKDAASTYTFVVFSVNKIIAIILIPFILIQAFSAPYITEIFGIIAFVIVVTLLIYRYLISWLTIKKDLQVNALHFFLYLCAVEILPVLLICKILINFFGKSI